MGAGAALSCQKGVLCIFEGDQSCGVPSNRLFIPGVSVWNRMGQGGSEGGLKGLQSHEVCE